MCGCGGGDERVVEGDAGEVRCEDLMLRRGEEEGLLGGGDIGSVGWNPVWRWSEVLMVVGLFR